MLELRMSNEWDSNDEDEETYNGFSDDDYVPEEIVSTTQDEFETKLKA